MKIIHSTLFTKTVAISVVMLFMTTPIFGQGYGGGMGSGGIGMGGGMGGMGGGMGGMPRSPLEKLKDSLRSAKNDATQKKIIAKISEMLSNQYDSFLRQNEAELQEMERSVKQLRDQLERRKSAKSQLLNLELQRIANEASGLVWPAEPSGMDGMGFMSGGGSGMGMMGMGGGPPMPSGAPGSAIQIPNDEFPLTSEPTPVADPETETTNQLRQITLAALNFESATKHLPKNILDEDGKPLLSWRVEILQFLGEPEQKLYEKFKLDEPWNSEHNVQLLDEMPDVFQNPSFKSNFKTVYQGFDGEGAMFESGNKLGFRDIADGSSNTIFVAQMNRQSATEWTKPADVNFVPGTPVTQLAESANGTAVIARCDGSVGKFKVEELDSDTLQHLIQRNDGNVVK